MSSESRSDTAFALRVQNVSKCYQIYDKPADRLKQILFGRNGKRYYKEFWANRDISLEVPKGTTCGIVGRNGAGKTTLLQMIAGTLRPTSGNIEIAGRITALLELGSGFHRDLTGRENVFMYGSVLGLSRAIVEQKFDRIAAFAEIGEFMERPVRTYSRGMFVRLAFSVLANLDPDIFIIDEALAVGDARFRHRCMLRFEEMQKNGTTILYVSHDAVSMKRLCSKVLWLDQGQAMAFGDPDETVDAYLHSMFGVPPAPQTPSVTNSNPVRGSDPSMVAVDSVALATNGTSTKDLSFDRRMGDQRSQIVSAALLNLDGEALTVVQGGSEVILRVSVVNNNLAPEKHHWCLGYRLRNFKGQELAGYNTDREKLPVDVAPTNEIRSFQFRITIPVFHPGDYTFSVGVSYRTLDKSEQHVADRLENVVHFRLTSRDKVHFLVGMPTTFAHESNDPATPRT